MWLRMKGIIEPLLHKLNGRLEGCGMRQSCEKQDVAGDEELMESWIKDSCFLHPSEGGWQKMTGETAGRYNILSTSHHVTKLGACRLDLGVRHPPHHVVEADNAVTQPRLNKRHQVQAFHCHKQHKSSMLQSDVCLRMPSKTSPRYLFRALS